MAEDTAPVATLHQGFDDLRLAWKRIAVESAPGVPELPGLIDNALSGLGLPDVSEETLARLAQTLSDRVQAAGFLREASTMFRRMGRAMYELLLVMGTEEELRSMGMLQSPAPAVSPEKVVVHSARPLQGVRPETDVPAPAAPSAEAPANNAPAPPRTQSAPSASLSPATEPNLRNIQLPSAPALRPTASGQGNGRPSASPGPLAAAASPQAVTPEQTRSRPESPAQAVDPSELWGFDPSARTSEVADAPSVPAAPAGNLNLSPKVSPGSEDVLPLEAADPPAASTAEDPVGAGPEPWTVRISPKVAAERRARLLRRQGEREPLVAEITAQVREQHMAVRAKSGPQKAIRIAAEELPSANAQLSLAKVDGLLANAEWVAAAGHVMRWLEVNPDETAAALACKAGEKIWEAGDEDLATLCLTGAVLSAPPCDRACWALAHIAIDTRHSQLAPVWLEFVARLLRLQGADQDAMVVYRQILTLAPKRRDIRDMLRSASLDGTLPD